MAGFYYYGGDPPVHQPAYLYGGAPVLDVEAVESAGAYAPIGLGSTTRRIVTRVQPVARSLRPMVGPAPDVLVVVAMPAAVLASAYALAPAGMVLRRTSPAAGASFCPHCGAAHAAPTGAAPRRFLPLKRSAQ